MRKTTILILIGLALLFPAAACINRDAPVLSATPTPTATLTPVPDAFSAQITAAPRPTDALGNEVFSDSHYERYLSYGEIRVYEYREDTFLDGLCWNSYSEPISADIRIAYYTEDGRVCGEGMLHAADGSHVFQSGTNRVYAEIQTDLDVKMMDFKLEYLTEPRPASKAGAH